MAAGDLIGAIVWRWCRNNQCDGQHPIHDSQSRERQCTARSRLGIWHHGSGKSGNELTIIGSKNSWYQVRLAGNKIGWVASWLVDQSEAATTSAKVATVNQPVNVREYASQDAKQLGTLNAGDSVKVVYQEGDWTQIAYNNTAAWITSSSVQLTGQTTNLAQPAQANLTQAKSGAALKVTTNTMTNLRNAAGINAPSVENSIKALN